MNISSRHEALHSITLELFIYFHFYLFIIIILFIYYLLLRQIAARHTYTNKQYLYKNKRLA